MTEDPMADSRDLLQVCRRMLQDLVNRTDRVRTLLEVVAQALELEEDPE
jgi:hypothetical protein